MPRIRLFFTPAGVTILAAALVILIRSLLARNSYEIVLSSAALLFLLVMGIIGAWKSGKLKSLEAGWKPPFPAVALSGEDTLITGLDEKVPLFFRLHFIVRGRFSPCGGVANNADHSAVGYNAVGYNAACPLLAETSVSRGEKTARLAMNFPVSGVFNGEGFCRLKDVFGFYSFSCGTPQRRTINVRSSPCFGKDYYINAHSGAEDRRNKTSSDEERYYMREYTPGDRFRDINWKSSEKIDSLITRISPDNQEKVSRIEVYFRNYGQVNKPSLEALWLLDRAKARLSHFLRSLMEMQSSYIFHVRAAGGSWEIEDEEDLDAFLEELAGTGFSPPQNEALFPHGADEIYVFSTACDTELNGFLLACNPRPVSLFLVQPLHEKESVKSKLSVWKKPLSPAGTEPKKDAETETLRKMDFPANGCFPLPRFLIRGKIKQLGVHAGKTEIIYVETKL
jgi:hypothetical protein